MANQDLLREAQRSHQQGRLDEAENLYKTILEKTPNDPDALHLLGVLHLQKGDLAKACELIGRAIESMPNVAAFYSNLAEAERRRGQFPEAEAHCRTALLLQPEYPEAAHNLGVILLKQRRAAEAETAFRRSLAHRPTHAGSLAGVADALRQQGQNAESLRVYRQSLDADPKQFAVHGNFGLLLAECGDFEKGLEHCREAVRLNPDSPLAHHHLGKLLLDYGRIDEAMDELAAARDRGEESAVLALSVGSAWFELGDLLQAKRWFEQALQLEPDLPLATCRLGIVHAEAEDYETAETLFRQALAKDPNCIDAHLGLARSLLEQGNVDEAVAVHREAINTFPEAAFPHAALGHTLSTAGDLDAAVASFRTAIELNPRCVPALSGLVTTQRGKAEDADLKTIEQLLSASWMTDARKASLHFALAHAYDGRGLWDRAAEELAVANALQKKHQSERERGYVPADYQVFVDRILATFTPEQFERTRGLGSESERPVFVVGMPRSGTTLTEQILASHPAVYGAGERRFAGLGFQYLPDAMRKVGTPFECVPLVDHQTLSTLAQWHLGKLDALDPAKKARIVDKMPENFLSLGWIATLFPRARIIHCRRDLRDVALSCWMTNFGSIRWANDLDHIAQRCEEYLRVMDHWRSVLPTPIFEVEYEQMVADQEGVSRRLLEHVGLEWNPACLAFHQTERLVRTASVTQVRQPIYRRSVARWKHYETALRPLLDRLESRL